MAASTSLNQQQRNERARLAALSRTTPEYHIKSLAKVTLTPEQADQLVRLVAPYIVARKPASQS
ncbi:MAG TPA: hypothetical protein VHS03_04495 [Gaiellaceae bacterium]|jgi:hypothetical protein|nr:hypothetical protein [Gaiellaceae bacterium]